MVWWNCPKSGDVTSAYSIDGGIGLSEPSPKIRSKGRGSGFLADISEVLPPTSKTQILLQRPHVLLSSVKSRRTILLLVKVYPYRTCCILRNHQRWLYRCVVVMVVSFDPRRCRMYRQSKLERRQSIRICNMSVILYYLQECIVELLITRTIGETAFSDSIEKGEVGG